jgi:hypothetical protein
MPNLKKKAHELTADETIKRIFHPKVLPHVKTHLKKIAKK